ncbi:MAG: undecaprenyldiphospho-muramoylpentapeptide beta-N-acetylglucosaminyltransferase [Saprospiraceae bacterium]
MNPQPKRVIVSGGGTGGHVFPAIAIADALRLLEPDIELLFVGAKGRMEMERVPKAGYRIEGLDIVGIQRRITWKNLVLPFKLLASMRQASLIIRQFQPDLAIGVGGYASGPILRVAAAKGVITMIQEQNSYAGITNRLLAKNAKRICVAYPGMEAFFPSAKIRLTGNPVRAEIAEIGEKKLEAYQEFKLDPEKKTVLVVGGSLGAKSLNEAMQMAPAMLEKHPDWQIIWQIGKAYFEMFKDTSPARKEGIIASMFIEKMDLAYAMADLVVCRAGALTISELMLAGKPSILVPSPNVAEDHQTKNAKAVVEAGAAYMVTENEIQDKLWEMVEILLEDPQKLEIIATKAKGLGTPNAAERIAEQILELIHNKA